MIKRLSPDHPSEVIEHQVMLPDGTIKWMEWTNKLLPGEDGAQNEYQAIGRDITEKREASEAVRLSEQRFRGTFQNAAIGIAHVGTDGAWLRVNERLCEIVGYVEEELLQKTFQEITHPDDLDADLDLLAKVSKSEIDNYSIEKRYVRKDGSLVWIDLTVSCIRDEQGGVDYFIAAIHQIDDRKRLIVELQGSEAHASPL